MKVIKRASKDINKEGAHGGSGARRVYVTGEHVNSGYFEAMTQGFLPAGKTFDWHEHKDTEEIMVVIQGDGEVHDDDGVYEYSKGDVFVFPSNTQHKIHNPTDEEHEMIFVRVKK